MICRFKRSRITEWRDVLVEEGRNLSAWGLVSMLGKMALVFVRGLFIRDRRWRQKMRACRRCPVYDRSMRRCRPYTGSTIGCGCYVPLIALFERECWGDEVLPEDAGWRRWSK